MENSRNDVIKITLLIIIAVISFAFLTRISGSPLLRSHELESLERKRTNITRLTAAATAASVGVSMLPDDTATPISENLADMTDYFLIALCAVYLEKYLITLTGLASFGVLFPLACVFLAIRVKRRDPRLSYYAKKLIAFGIAIMLIIPASVTVSDSIESTYQFSIDETINNAESLSDAIEQETEKMDSESGFFESIIDGASSVVSTVVDKATEWLTAGERILNELLETLAVLLVTSCLIPIAVLFFFLWLIQLFTDIDRPMPYPRRIGLTKKMLKLPKK